MSYIKEILNSREIVYNLTSRQIKGQYKRTFFGQLWSLANPIALVIVYTFVFSFIFRISPGPGDPSGLEAFPLWLLAGLLPWTFFARATLSGSQSLTSNSGLIQKVYFPRIALPFSGVFAIAYNWTFEMAVLLLALLVMGAAVYFTLPFLVIAMFLMLIFALGISFLVSIANVYFRDTEHFLSIVLQLMMYLSPVVYPISLVQKQSDEMGGIFGSQITLIDVYSLNPIVSFLQLFRDLLYNVKIPEFEVWITSGTWALTIFTIGYLVFSKNDKNLAEQL